LDEIKHLSKRYGWDLPSMQIPIYKAFKKYLADGVTLDEAIKFSVSNEMKLARKQRTWFKRNKAVHWINKQRQAVDLITTKLNK
jgi:tRNA dimethylallyltransferase